MFFLGMADVVLFPGILYMHQGAFANTAGVLPIDSDRLAYIAGGILGPAVMR
jgi:hypothetical protein